MKIDDAIENFTLALQSPRPRAWGTRQTYLCQGTQYLHWLGEDRIPPGEKEVRLYVIKRRDDGWTEGSLATLFASLKKLHLSNEWSWKFTGDDRPLPQSDVKSPAFTEEEVATLIHNRGEYAKGEVFYLALATIFAPRREELARVRKKDLTIGDETSSLLIHTAKKGPERLHLIPEEILPAILDYKPKGLKPISLTNMFHRICAKGLGDPMPGYGWHSFRRTINTLAPINLANARIPLTYWPEYMRWSRKGIGREFMGSAMAGHYTHPEILAFGDPFALDRLLLPIHPILHYWREE